MTFIDVLTVELRSQSKKHYLFEDIEGNYRDEMIKIFNKAIQSELSASAVYYLVSQRMTGFNEHEIAEELEKHSKEEYKHFTELLTYASNHGIIQSINLSLMPYTQQYPSGEDLDAVIEWKQNLEKDAIKDYENAAKISEGKGDMLTMEFFKELMKDERKHYDDLQKYKKGYDEF